MIENHFSIISSREFDNLFFIKTILLYELVHSQINFRITFQNKWCAHRDLLDGKVKMALLCFGQ